MYEECILCPRKCKVNRNKSVGFCGVGAKLKVSKAMLHLWEEPPISGEKGSGAVFFSHCTLKCCFCQNYKISSEGFGKEISEKRLEEIFLNLAQNGANNINLVSATQYIPQIIKVLDIVKPKINIPIVYNTSGYEIVETIKSLDGYVDIYLPDLKYKSSNLSAKYSGAKDYFEYASKAILEMHRQVPKNIYTKDGLLKKGIIIRHMVMPNCTYDTKDILMWIKENLPLDDILISIMSQYTPFYKSKNIDEINRRLTEEEYNEVMDFALDIGIENGFMQELSSAKEEYTPNFDLEGV